MGLLDIAPPEIVVRRFEIRGGFIEIQGIKNKDWAALMHRFVKLRQISAGELPNENVLEIDGLVPAVIAAGLGACGDADTESLIIERLSDSEQIIIFGEIMQLTAPEANNGPLLKSLEEHRPRPILNGSAEEPTKNSPQPSLL